MKNGSEGWFDTEIEVRCDGWRGKFGASFMQGELSRFAQEVQTLHKQLHGKATLEPMEPNLTLSLRRRQGPCRGYRCGQKPVPYENQTDL